MNFYFDRIWSVPSFVFPQYCLLDLGFGRKRKIFSSWLLVKSFDEVYKSTSFLSTVMARLVAPSNAPGAPEAIFPSCEVESYAGAT